MAYRVIQWATGAIGKTCLRQVIDHPDLELVGLYVHSPQKVGKDAGEIARRGRTGVRATNLVDEILAIDADVVLYLPLNPGGTLIDHDETIRRLLRSGKNVITTVAHTFPWAHGPEYAGAFEEAGRAGNATLFGTGINPGFIAERLAVMLTGTCTHVDSIEVAEIYDCSPILSAPFIFDLMGVGQAVETIRRGTRVQSIFNHIFREVVAYVGHAMRVEFDEIVADPEFGIAEKDLQLPAGLVRAGTVANFRWRYRGMRGGQPFFTISMLWITDPAMKGWEMVDGWTIEIKGTPGIRARIDLVEPVGMQDRSKAMQYCVAGPVIRAIPDVVQAPPGILLLPSFAPYTPRMA